MIELTSLSCTRSGGCGGQSGSFDPRMWKNTDTDLKYHKYVLRRFSPLAHHPINLIVIPVNDRKMLCINLSFG